MEDFAVVNTPMSKSFTEVDAIREKMMAGHPLRGFGEPEDIAKVAVFLASEDAGWITGVPLPVDGELLFRLVFNVPELS